MSEQVKVCIHCGNPVEAINYGERPKHISYGTLENKYKHSKPREYPVCSVNPLMEEDVEFVDVEESSEQ